eukprot:964990_1
MHDGFSQEQDIMKRPLPLIVLAVLFAGSCFCEENSMLSDDQYALSEKEYLVNMPLHNNDRKLILALWKSTNCAVKWTNKCGWNATRADCPWHKGCVTCW